MCNVLGRISLRDERKLFIQEEERLYIESTGRSNPKMDNFYILLLLYIMIVFVSSFFFFLNGFYVCLFVFIVIFEIITEKLNAKIVNTIVIKSPSKKKGEKHFVHAYLLREAHSHTPF